MGYRSLGQLASTASGAKLALIVGEDELEAGEVTVKPLREARAQARVPLARLAAEFPDWRKPRP